LHPRISPPFYGLFNVFELYVAEILSFLTSLFLSTARSAPISETYRDLPNAEWIRLLKIYKTSNRVISIELEEFPLKDAPPYHALSYAWGPAEGMPVYSHTNLDLSKFHFHFET
jgi:hypothetical protein